MEKAMKQGGGGFGGGGFGGFPGGGQGGGFGGFPGGMQIWPALQPLGPGMQGPFFGGFSFPNRLGVQFAEPGQVLVDQLSLPRGEGLVVHNILLESAAAKAGLKNHDILLELGGKKVSHHQHEFMKVLNEFKTGTTVDVVVVCKGQKQTLKGLTLPDAPAQNFPGNFQFQRSRAASNSSCRATRRKESSPRFRWCRPPLLRRRSAASSGAAQTACQRPLTTLGSFSPRRANTAMFATVSRSRCIALG